VGGLLRNAWKTDAEIQGYQKQMSFLLKEVPGCFEWSVSLLLMVQKSGDHHLGSIRPCQPQVVSAGFLPPSTV